MKELVCRKCSTIYCLLNDHPGPTRLCRKCANRHTERQAWEHTSRLFPGDLVVMCDSTHLSLQWQQSFDPHIVEEMMLEPAYARLGVVSRVLDNLTVEVQSLRCPEVVATKIYIPQDRDNLMEKVGHIVYEHGRGPVKTLYPHASFMYTEMVRSGRTGFQVKLPPAPRGQN